MKAEEIPIGQIKVGQAPEAWGFDTDTWSGDSYLWKHNANCIIGSLLIAKAPRTGAFRRLLAGVEADGYWMAIPTPSRVFIEVLTHLGFESHYFWDKEAQEHVNLWVRSPSYPG